MGSYCSKPVFMTILLLFYCDTHAFAFAQTHFWVLTLSLFAYLCIHFLHSSLVSSWMLWTRTSSRLATELSIKPIFSPCQLCCHSTHCSRLKSRYDMHFYLPLLLLRMLHSSLSLKFFMVWFHIFREIKYSLMVDFTDFQLPWLPNSVNEETLKLVQESFFFFFLLLNANSTAVTPSGQYICSHFARWTHKKQPALRTTQIVNRST